MRPPALFLPLTLFLAACGRKPVPPPPVLPALPGAASPAAPPSAAVGRLSGRVIYKGPPVEPKKLDVTLDQHACGTEAKRSEALIVGPDGGVANAVVWVVGAEPGPMPAPSAPLRVTQKACVFTPHVALVPKGGQIVVRNEDAVAHNFKAAGQGGNSYNFNQPGGAENSVAFPDAGIVPVECSFHYWMTGYVVVAAHRLYALTGPDGRYVLDDVPSGQRRMKVWHESIGTLTQGRTELDLPVFGGATTEVDFILEPAGK